MIKHCPADNHLPCSIVGEVVGEVRGELPEPSTQAEPPSIYETLMERAHQHEGIR